jgi:MFS family permease
MVERIEQIVKRIRELIASYPRQFWLLFWGQLINTIGSSMIWPFFLIYMSQQLNVPEDRLSDVTWLFTVSSIAGLVGGAVTGPLVDRFGRKSAMVLSLAVGAMTMVGMGVASTLPAMLVVVVLMGAFGPLYRIGNEAMIADLIEPERRPGAYALMRMINNVGVAIGPLLGGVVVVVSYLLAFSIAAAAQALFAILILLFVAETLGRATAGNLAQPAQAATSAERGYGPVFRDRPFILFAAVYVLAGIVYSLMMTLLPVYAKNNFGVLENQYSWILTTNALMVVLFQYVITRRTERLAHLPVLAVGSLFYAAGVGAVALGYDFPTFLVGMVILTVGEMLMIPTATALTANLAPPDMRGRYMSVYGLTWGIAFGIGPVLGAQLNDRVAPVAIWYGGLVIGLAAALGFALLARRVRPAPVSEPAPVVASANGHERADEMPAQAEADPYTSSVSPSP